MRIQSAPKKDNYIVRDNNGIGYLVDATTPEEAEYKFRKATKYRDALNVTVEKLK